MLWSSFQLPNYLAGALWVAPIGHVIGILRTPAIDSYVRGAKLCLVLVIRSALAQGVPAHMFAWWQSPTKGIMHCVAHYALCCLKRSYWFSPVCTHTGSTSALCIMMLKTFLLVQPCVHTYRKYQRTVHSDADLERQVDKAFRWGLESVKK